MFQQSSGGTETGKYVIIGSGYTTNAVMGWYYPSLSRGATPVSVSIDTADLSNNVNSTGTNRLTANGFDITTQVNAASTNSGVGGNFTIQY